MFAPLLRTGFSRVCSAGVDVGIATALTALFVGLARGTAARGAGAMGGATAGCEISAAGTVTDDSRWVRDGPIATPSATAPMKPATRSDALPRVIFLPPCGSL